MISAGIVCAGGSDAPIETSNPFQGIYDAMFRCKENTPVSECFNIEERLSFPVALQLYTLNGAFAAKEENYLGEIRPTYAADFVILEFDVIADASKLLAENLVQSVWVNGKEMYSPSQNPNLLAAISNRTNPSAPGKNGKIRICKCCR